MRERPLERLEVASEHPLEDGAAMEDECCTHEELRTPKSARLKLRKHVGEGGKSERKHEQGHQARDHSGKRGDRGLLAPTRCQLLLLELASIVIDVHG